MLVVLAGLSLPLGASAATLYLCKGYSGGMFWSSVTCSQKSATIDRMVTVPDDMPWDQQVQYGEQVKANAAAIAAPPPRPVVIQQQTQQDPKAECKALDTRVTWLDSMARQPQSGYTQDWITAEKKAARDRQFRMKC